jgi:hypothetical protein
MYTHILCLYAFVCIALSNTCLVRATLDQFNSTYHGTLGLDQIEYIEVRTTPNAVTYIDLTVSKCGGLTSLLSRFGALPALARYDMLIPLRTDKHGVCTARARTTSATRQVCVVMLHRTHSRNVKGIASLPALYVERRPPSLTNSIDAILCIVLPTGSNVLCYSWWLAAVWQQVL